MTWMSLPAMGLDRGATTAETFVTMLIVAGASMQCVVLWIGCFFNFMDGWSLLAWASDRGHLCCVRKLLAWGPDVVSNADYVGDTPLIRASRRGHAGIVDALLGARADANATNRRGETALYCASDRGHESVTDALLRAGANLTVSKSGLEQPLLRAARAGAAGVVSRLLEHKADPGCVNNKGRTALVVACIRNQAACAQVLLDCKRTDVEKPDSNGLTPLIWASLHGYLHLVRALVSAGADIEAYDNTQRSALMWAAVQAKWETAHFLARRGAVAGPRDYDQGVRDIRRTWEGALASEHVRTWTQLVKSTRARTRSALSALRIFRRDGAKPNRSEARLLLLVAAYLGASSTGGPAE